MRLNFFSKTATLAVFEKSIEKFILPCILSDIGIFLYSILPPLRLAFRLIRYPFSMRAVSLGQIRSLWIYRIILCRVSIITAAEHLPLATMPVRKGSSLSVSTNERNEHICRRK